MKQPDEKEFAKLVSYIKDNYGINLYHKKSLVIGRLHNYLATKGFNDFSEYLSYVFSDKTGLAAAELLNKLTTNHTYFMREPEHFQYFRSTVLPQMVSKLVSNRDLRIWSAGCSSGEEPYTLTMLIDSFFAEGKGGWDTKILATDISTKALEIAIKGVYLNEHLASLPVMWRDMYFRKLDAEYSVVSEAVKKEVIFRRFNLMSDVFPFKKRFHIIFCRNVMIYFDQQTKNDLVSKFYDCTEPGGYLFIGHSESLNRQETNYKYVMPAVYRKD